MRSYEIYEQIDINDPEESKLLNELALGYLTRPYCIVWHNGYRYSICSWYWQDRSQAKILQLMAENSIGSSSDKFLLQLINKIDCHKGYEYRENHYLLWKYQKV